MKKYKYIAARQVQRALFRAIKGEAYHVGGVSFMVRTNRLLLNALKSL